LAIAPGSLLSLNSYSVAPLAEAASFGLRLRGNAQAIVTAVEEAGKLNGDQKRREVDTAVRSAALIAFDAKGRTVETLLNTGNLLDVFV
tara:strand:- start:457 stop:723 length:267 start_codon:yes stop_codon:yes gene_type:complete